MTAPRRTGKTVKTYAPHNHYKTGRPWQVMSACSREDAQLIFEMNEEGASLRVINLAMGRSAKNRMPTRLLSDKKFWDPYPDWVVVQRILAGGPNLQQLLDTVTFYEWRDVEADLLRRMPWRIDVYDQTRLAERAAWQMLPTELRDHVWQHFRRGGARFIKAQEEAA